MTEQRDTWLDILLDRLGRQMTAKLRSASTGYRPFAPPDHDSLRRTLRPGDILLVEGNERISSAIKYLTQSTWSHAAMYVGDALPESDTQPGQERATLIEVNLGEGCVAVPLSKYQYHNTRICRAVGLSDAERAELVAFMVDKLGLRYDMRNVIDLLRYFFPTPPVPVRWRRRMLAFGSGDPTRAICSSLIAQAYQSIRYPILPIIRVSGGEGEYARREVFHIRHHSLYAPRDFDLSPFFAVVKPTIESGFDHRVLSWADPDAAPEAGHDAAASASMSSSARNTSSGRS